MCVLKFNDIIISQHLSSDGVTIQKSYFAIKICALKTCCHHSEFLRCVIYGASSYTAIDIYKNSYKVDGVFELVKLLYLY